MAQNRQIAMLFEKDGKALVTTMDVRSRMRFRKLVSDFIPGGKVIDSAAIDAAFHYVALETVLTDTETYYQTLKETAAGQHIAGRVDELIEKIRVHSDDDEE